MYEINRKISVPYFKLSPWATEPTYGTPHSACFDLYACTDHVGQWYELPPGEVVFIHTGLCFDFSPHTFMRIYSRSGLSTRKGLTLVNGVGVIDNDYVDEVMIPMVNVGNETEYVKHGERVAQAEIVMRDYKADLTELKERPSPKGERKGGFGSTGAF